MRTVLADFVDSAMPDTKLLMPAQHKQYVKDFRSAPFFKAFDVNEVAVILGGAEVVEYSAGERIIAEGGQARWIFLLVSGMATAHMEMLPSYKKDYSSPGDFFGEQAIVKHHKFKDHAGVPVRRAATIVAGEHGAVCLVIRMNNDIEKQLIEKNSGLFNRSQVRKTRLFAPFDTKNDRFAKTGSGQTLGKHSQREAFSYRIPTTLWSKTSSRQTARLPLWRAANRSPHRRCASA